MVKEFENWNGTGISRKIRRRAIIFWHHANTFYALQERNVRIDYKRAKERLARSYHLVAPVMYIGKPEILKPEKKNFLKTLSKLGWSIQDKPLVKDKNGKHRQKGVDKLMLSDIAILAEEDAYEVAIIVSGDALFCDIVLKLKNMMKKVELWAFKETLSTQLIGCVECRNVYYLDDILDEITYEK